LIGFNTNVEYNTAMLDVASGFGSSDITMGSLFASAGGWTMLSYVDDATGHIGLSFFTTTPMTGGTGSIADVRFHLPLNGSSGSVGLDVNGAAGSETGLVYTYSDGSIDIDASTPSIVGTDGNDSYYIRRTAYDMVEVYAGTSASGTPIYSALLASISSVSFDTGAGDDQLIVDLANGTPLPSAGISYSAGIDNDSLTLTGNGSSNAAYMPGASSGSGNFAIGASAIAFAGVEPVSASGLSSLVVVTPGASDVIQLTTPQAGKGRVSGTSDGAAFSPLTFFACGEVLLDTPPMTEQPATTPSPSPPEISRPSSTP